MWMTGRPCSGKTTIARQLEKSIPNLAVLDGDELYKWLGTYEFSREARISKNKRVAHLAKLLMKHDVPVCVSMISPYNETRMNAKKIINSEYFYQIYVKCDFQECEKRDVKGMYKQAKEGKIKNFIGIDMPYEEPTNPDLILDTQVDTIDNSIKKIMLFIKEQKK